MPTVAEKQRLIQQKHGISAQQFAQLFEESTGRKLSPQLMDQDYDALRKAKIGSVQSFAEQAAGVGAELAGTVGGAVEEAGKIAFESGKMFGQMAQNVLGVADKEQNIFAKFDDIDKQLKQLDQESQSKPATLEQSRQRTELQRRLADAVKQQRDEFPAIGRFVDVADTYAKESADLKDRDFLENANNDLQEFIEAFPILFKELATITDTGGSLSMLERVTVDRASEGRDLGKNLVSGALGVTGLVVSRLVGSVENAIAGKENAFDPFFELFNARPVTVITTLTPMKLKLKRMAAAGDPAARSLLAKMKARGIIKALDKAEEGMGTILRKMDEAPAKAVSKATGGRFMPQKERARVIGKTEDAPTASGLFEADVTTTPLRVSDVANAALRGAGYGLLAGEPGVGAAIGALVEGTFGIGRNSKRFKEATAAVGRYLQTINVGRTINEQVAKQQLSDDAAKIRDFLESRGLPLRALSEEGRLVRDQAATGAQAARPRQVVTPIYDIDDLGVVTNERLRARDVIDTDPAPLSKEAAKIVSEMGSELEKIGISPNRVAKLRETIVDIGNGGISLLRSDAFRNAVLDELVSGLKGKQKANARRQLNKTLSDASETASLGDRRVMPVIRIGDQQIDLMPTISKVLESLDPKKKGGLKNRRKVESEVIAKTVQDEAINAMGKARSKAMNMEAARPLIASGMKASQAIDAVRLGKVSLDEYARAVLSKALDGEAMPQVLPRNIEATKLAAAISRLKTDGNFVGQVTKRRRRGASQEDVIESVSRRADDLADDLINSFAEETFNYRSRVDNAILGAAFEKVKPKTAKDILRDLQDDGVISDPTLRKQMEAALEASGIRVAGDAPIRGRTISKSLQSSLDLLDDIKHSASTFNQFYNYMKMNLTVYRTATGVNNLLSNVWFQGIRRGDPVGVLVRGAKLARQYKKYTEGKYKPANAREANIFRQIEESGIAKTNLLDAELDVIQSGLRGIGQGDKFSGTAFLSKAKSAGKKALQIAMLKKPLEAFYRLGDNLFKIEEMHTAMKSLYKDMDAMKVGDFIEFRTAPNTFARITRKKDGFYQGKRKLGGVDDRRVAKILGAAGRRSAVDMFVDYSSRPGLVRKLQNLGPLSIVSPFLTWHFKAMGMGEKGFLSRALMPDALVSKTNNKAIASRQANQLLIQMLRRQAITAEGRRQMNEDRRFFKEVMAYIPGETRATIFADIADPRYTRAMYLGGQDFMSSEATKIAMLGRVIGLVGQAVPQAPKDLIEEGVFGLGDDIKKGRELFQIKKEAGAKPGLASAMRLLGLSGQPLVEELQLLQNSYRHRGGKPDINGVPMSTAEIIKRYASFAAPATSRVLVEELLRQTGVIDEQNKANDRWKTFNPTDPAGHERASEYLVRQLFGIGFRPVALTGDKGAMKRYLDRAERVLNASYNEAIKKTLEQAKDDPDYKPDVQELRRLKTRAVTIGAQIKKQILEDYATVVEGRRKRMTK